ncbi:MAG TPA: nicotinate-nucleotide--dimethylbenzimidazole phosphoribosyltransferase [Methylomirabilota bacterium]
MIALERLITSIVVPDERLAATARQRLDSLTKPRGSLGRLEDLVVRVVVMTGSAMPRVDAPVIFTLAGDHGVATEGVSAYPQAVTAQMVENFARGGAGVNVLARHVGARVVVANFGVAAPLGERAGIVERRIAPGTRSITKGPAMTREEAVRAIAEGAALVEAAAPDCVGTGEMGIGNTTAASALTAALTGADPAMVTGRGTGVADDVWVAKVDAVRRALGANRQDAGDALGVLAALGGFEIAGLVGVVLAGAARRVPVVLDGFIATAGALVAARLAPAARDYMIAAHRSAEPGHVRQLEALGLTPYLELGMRLGEGTGAALGIGLLRAALACYREMATFKEAGVSERLR